MLLLAVTVFVLFKYSRKENYAHLLAPVKGFRNRELTVPFSLRLKCRQETVGSMVVLILVCT